MVEITQLVTDVADVIRECPGVLAELGGNADAVVAYLDLTTGDSNSLARAIYSQPNGTVLIAWQTTDLAETESVEGWQHMLGVYVRALRQQSPLDLLNAIIDGIPAGDQLKWRYQCVNEAVLPVQILEIARIVDEEGIDYYAIRMAFTEKGD